MPAALCGLSQVNEPFGRPGAGFPGDVSDFRPPCDGQNVRHGGR